MQYRGKKIVVTGGCGFIGSHLVEALLNKNAQVVIIDNLSSGEFRNPNAQLHQIDIVDKDALSNVIDENVYAIFHLAAHFGHPRSLIDPILGLEVNVRGSLNILEICREIGTPRLVFASTFSVYGESDALPLTEDSNCDPRSPYDVSKLSMEKYINAYHILFGLRSVILRFSNAYGPRDLSGKYRSAVSNFIFNILNGFPPKLHFEGKATRDFIFIDDMVQALLLAGSKENAIGQTFNVCTGIETTIKDIVQQIIDISGKKIEPVLIPSKQFYSSRLVGSCDKAKNMLGFNPNVSIDSGLKKTIEWCEDNWDEFSIPQPYSYLE